MSQEDLKCLLAACMGGIIHTAELQWRVYVNQVLTLRDAYLVNSVFDDKTKLALRHAPVVKSSLFGPFPAIAREIYESDLAKQRAAKPPSIIVRLTNPATPKVVKQAVKRKASTKAVATKPFLAGAGVQPSAKRTKKATTDSSQKSTGKRRGKKSAAQGSAAPNASTQSSDKPVYKRKFNKQ